MKASVLPARSLTSIAPAITAPKTARPAASERRPRPRRIDEPDDGGTGEHGDRRTCSNVASREAVQANEAPLQTRRAARPTSAGTAATLHGRNRPDRRQDEQRGSEPDCHRLPLLRRDAAATEGESERDGEEHQRRQRENRCRDQSPAYRDCSRRQTVVDRGHDWSANARLAAQPPLPSVRSRRTTPSSVIRPSWPELGTSRRTACSSSCGPSVVGGDPVPLRSTASRARPGSSEAPGAAVPPTGDSASAAAGSRDGSSRPAAFAPRA